MRVKTRETFTIDGELAKEFKRVCDKNSLVYSNIVELLMRNWVEGMEGSKLFNEPLDKMSAKDFIEGLGRIITNIQIKSD